MDLSNFNFCEINNGTNKLNSRLATDQMTLVIGIQCSDDVVLAADGRLMDGYKSWKEIK